MTPRVQGPIKATFTSGSALTLSLKTAPVSGNLLVLCFGYANATHSINSLISAISQVGVVWKQAVSQADTTNGIGQCIWYGVVSSGASQSLTIALKAALDAVGGAVAIIDCCEYTSFGVLDQTATQGLASGTMTSTGTTPVTTQANELWVGMVQGISGGDQINPTANGFTLLDGEAYTSGSMFMTLAYLEKVVSAVGQAGSGATFTNPGSHWFEGCIATFAPPAPPPPPQATTLKLTVMQAPS
jgi:hypothetical protein